MGDTTIKVNIAVRDRLAILARQRGCTLGELVAELAASTPTEAELNARYAAAAAYIHEHLCPELTADDREAGQRLLRDLNAGIVTTI